MLQVSIIFSSYEQMSTTDLHQFCDCTVTELRQYCECTVTVLQQHCDSTAGQYCVSTVSVL